MRGWVPAFFLLGVVLGFAAGFVAGSPTFVIKIGADTFDFVPNKPATETTPDGVIGMRG